MRVRDIVKRYYELAANTFNLVSHRRFAKWEEALSNKDRRKLHKYWKSVIDRK